MYFREVEQFAADTANLVPMNLENKEKLRDMMLAIISNAAVSYSQDADFKREVDRYRSYMKRR